MSRPEPAASVTMSMPVRQTTALTEIYADEDPIMRLFVFCLLVLALQVRVSPMSASASPVHWKLLQTIKADDWGTAPLALSPDGHLLASFFWPDIVLRDPATGQIRFRLHAPRYASLRLALPPLLQP